MPLIPPFQIGVWNVWIFMVYSIILGFLPSIIFNKDNLSVPTSQSETEKRYRLPWFILYLLTFIYSIFLPLRPGTAWFYVGLPICLLGAILLTITGMNFGRTPLNNEPATGGLYRYSRHPLYVTMFIMLLGAGIASTSWIVILFAVISMILWVPLAISEEEFCLELYGDSYREYMNQAPRWIGIPKSAEK
jgi:protein-S-isoprenylcysteine O-methyltransferase Ste14